MNLLTAERSLLESANWDKFLSVGLLYPNVYSLGMSNLGFQTLYRRLNQRDDVSCERIFYPSQRSLETNKPLNAFDCICITVPYELDFHNALSLLDKGHIPLLTSERGERDPLIIIGGAFASINCEPMADFADIISIGEGESILNELFDHVYDRKAHSIFKDHFLENVTGIPGIYVPSFPEANPESIEPIIRVLKGMQTYSPIVTPNAHFADTFLVEVNRGCPFGCRFCAVRQIYRPFREYALEDIWDAIQKGSALTKKVGLVGSAIGSVSYFDELLRRLAENRFDVGLSSLRTDKITSEVVEYLTACNVNTLTIAPEAGSQQMRDVIRKKLTEPEILAAAEVIRNAGIPNVKLYFIVGLPEETQDDIQAIVALSRKIRDVTNANIHLSINPFVPKPKTPFQDYPMASESELKRKYKFIKSALQPEKKIRLSFESIRLAKIQALLSNGDRELSDLLILKATTNKNWNECLRRVGNKG